MTRFIAVIGFILSLSSFPLHAATYCADGDGENGNGTPVAPFNTLQAALVVMQPGDTLNATGHFAEVVHLTSALRGTAQHPTVIQRWQDHSMPVNDVSNGDRDGNPVHNIFHVDGADHVVVRGFEVVGGMTGILFIDSAHGCAEDNLIHGAKLKGLCFRDAPFGRIVGNESFENEETGILVPEDRSDDVGVVRNIVHHNGFHGILFHAETERARAVENVVYANNTRGHDSGGGIIAEGVGAEDLMIEDNFIEQERPSAAIGISGRRSVSVRGNTVEGLVLLHRVQEGSVTGNTVIDAWPMILRELSPLVAVTGNQLIHQRKSGE
jgi:hypothetical protein